MTEEVKTEGETPQTPKRGQRGQQQAAPKEQPQKPEEKPAGKREVKLENGLTITYN